MPRQNGICGCMEPVDLPDMRCGDCGNRRLGDLTVEQSRELSDALMEVLAIDGDWLDRPLCRRRKGRKRPRARMT